jgi:hypothetical protein
VLFQNNHRGQTADTTNVDVHFIVSLSNAAIEDVPADADVLRDTAAVFGDTINGT